MSRKGHIYKIQMCHIFKRFLLIISKVEILKIIEMNYITCNHGGTHAGQVEPTSTIELPMSRIEALQAERHSTGSLETFAQFFLHWAWLKTRCPKRCSRHALIVFAYATFEAVWKLYPTNSASRLLPYQVRLVFS